MNEAHIKKVLFEAYEARLRQTLGESDVVDKEGNVLITPDLKVKDKKSGYVYTVDSVKKSKDGNVIVLRAPDEPRFDPPRGDEHIDVYTPGSKYDTKPETLVVSQKDFETNFEVE